MAEEQERPIRHPCHLRHQYHRDTDSDETSCCCISVVNVNIVGNVEEGERKPTREQQEGEVNLGCVR